MRQILLELYDDPLAFSHTLHLKQWYTTRREPKDKIQTAARMKPGAPVNPTDCKNMAIHYYRSYNSNKSTNKEEQETYSPVVIVGDVPASTVRLKGSENVRSLGSVSCQDEVVREIS